MEILSAERTNSNTATTTNNAQAGSKWPLPFRDPLSLEVLNLCLRARYLLAPDGPRPRGSEAAREWERAIAAKIVEAADWIEESISRGDQG